MLLEQDGTRFRLEILRYQYPGVNDRGHDSNWLIVRMDLHTPRGVWHCTEPMLETLDVAEMAAWFEGIAAGGRVRQRLAFIEPNLEFHLVASDINGGATLRIHFDQEARPRWSEGEMESIILTVGPEQLLKAACDLRAALDRWPIR